MKLAKTNAMRLLEKHKIPYTPYEYDTSDGLLDGVSVANKTGQKPAAVFKTLVTRAGGGSIYVFCIPVEAELDLKQAARLAGEKNIAMLPPGEITAVTGYIKGGCSPLGMKKQYPTFVHGSARALGAMVVSGGRVGLQMKLAPVHLLQLTGARWMDE